MAKKNNKKYNYIPLSPSEIRIAMTYYSNAEGNSSKFTAHQVRGRIRVDRKAGIHNDETEESYNEYREDLLRWASKGWLYKREEIREDIDPETISQTYQTVSVTQSIDAMTAALDSLFIPQTSLFQ